MLERLAIPLHNQGLEVTARIVFGESLHIAILEYLRSSNATLLVKDTHHHSLPRRTFLKNTDWYLAHSSTVPLLLTKNRISNPEVCRTHARGTGSHHIHNYRDVRRIKMAQK